MILANYVICSSNKTLICKESYALKQNLEISFLLIQYINKGINFHNRHDSTDTIFKDDFIISIWQTM